VILIFIESVEQCHLLPRLLRRRCRLELELAVEIVARKLVELVGAPRRVDEVGGDLGVHGYRGRGNSGRGQPLQRLLAAVRGERCPFDHRSDRIPDRSCRQSPGADPDHLRSLRRGYRQGVRSVPGVRLVPNDPHCECLDALESGCQSPEIFER
jgi:hypothetical protein